MLAAGPTHVVVDHISSGGPSGWWPILLEGFLGGLVGTAIAAGIALIIMHRTLKADEERQNVALRVEEKRQADALRIEEQRQAAAIKAADAAEDERRRRQVGDALSDRALDMYAVLGQPANLRTRDAFLAWTKAKNVHIRMNEQYGAEYPNSCGYFNALLNLAQVREVNTPGKNAFGNVGVFLSQRGAEWTADPHAFERKYNADSARRDLESSSPSKPPVSEPDPTDITDGGAE
ncbi:MAG TPA: hypothetical protein VHX59_12680 [Mycobacteriales bacterium]|jgi:hypothetical protein|nr:hypothetical protein [Mycobacteriales bacterium]